MTVGVLTTCHAQYTWDKSICIFLINRTKFQVFVTNLTGALYVHHLWFYKLQHDNGVPSKLFVACQLWWFYWWFWFVPSVPGYLREEEEHKPDPWRNPSRKKWHGFHLENEVKTPTIIFNNPVYDIVNSNIPTLKSVYSAVRTGSLNNAVCALSSNGYLRTNSDLCHLQHKLIGFYNRDEKCLQRGTDWVFK
jgi:hypothetical protein